IILFNHSSDNLSDKVHKRSDKVHKRNWFKGATNSNASKVQLAAPPHATLHKLEHCVFKTNLKKHSTIMNKTVLLDRNKEEHAEQLTDPSDDEELPLDDSQKDSATQLKNGRFEAIGNHNSLG
uniref:BRCA1 n=1 Tax=Romanomermis culicivorax TaxID=13658 RepID=A0A915HUD9_ROMCU